MNILFAEDDDLLRNSLTFYLKNNGFTVTPVSNGLEVKDQLKMTPFDLIITDLNMPFFGGMEVINFVRNELKWGEGQRRERGCKSTPHERDASESSQRRPYARSARDAHDWSRPSTHVADQPSSSLNLPPHCN